MTVPPDQLIAARGWVLGYAAPVIGPLDFSLRRGEVLGLCGQNGCGKSTLVAAITGGVRVFAGRLYRAPGTVIAHQEQAAPDVAGLPLNVADWAALSAVSLAAAPDWLRALHAQRLDQLSGGQFQLLRVWACLAAKADLVILDEPTNNLDPHGIALLGELITSLHHRPGQRAGVLLISHDAAFLARCSQRRLMLGAPVCTSP